MKNEKENIISKLEQNINDLEAKNKEIHQINNLKITELTREDERLVERCQTLERKNTDDSANHKTEIAELKDEIKKRQKWIEENKNKYEQELGKLKQTIAKMKEDLEEKTAQVASKEWDLDRTN